MKRLLLACLLIVACEVEDDDLGFQQDFTSCNNGDYRCEANVKQKCVNDSWVDIIDCEAKTCAFVLIGTELIPQCIIY